MEAIDILSKAANTSSPATTTNTLVPSKSENEDIFAHLLRASLDSSQESASLVDETIRQDTINKLSEGGDITALDIRSIVGDTLAVISDELGIDMKEELMADKNVKASLQAIMKSSLAELASNISSIDNSYINIATSEDGIFNMLDNISDQLKEDDSSAPMDDKDIAFQKLLKDQEFKSKQLEESRKRLQESSKRLESVMAEYEYTVPPLT
jgi:hypothetical protein